MIIVRIYLREADLGYHKGLLLEIKSILYDRHRVHGVTLFRGIAGFGRHGEIHLVDLLRLNVYRQSAQTDLAAHEWERGTLESLLVTPVTLGELLVGKTLPYFALGMGAMGVSVNIAIW